MEAGEEGLLLHLVVLLQLVDDGLALIAKRISPLMQNVMARLDFVVLLNGQHIHRLQIYHGLFQRPDLLSHDLALGRLLCRVYPAGLDLRAKSVHL